MNQVTYPPDRDKPEPPRYGWQDVVPDLNPPEQPMIHVTLPPNYRTPTKERAMTELPPQVQHWEQTQEPMTYAEAFDRIETLMRAQDLPCRSFRFTPDAWFQDHAGITGNQYRTFVWELYLAHFQKHMRANTLEQIIADLEQFLTPGPIADQFAAASILPTTETVQ